MELNMHPLFDLSGRIILVTGAGKGIGRATVDVLAEAGAIVHAADLNADLADATAAAWPGNVTAHRLDVRDESCWAGVVAPIGAAHGRLDGLVNNAGIFLMKPIEATSLEDWRAVQAEGVFLGCKHALPLLKAGGAANPNGASIVNLSSMYGIASDANLTAYAGSKGAVRLLTKSLASELARAKANVRVNSVHPGFTATDLALDPLKAMVAAGQLPSVEMALGFIQQRVAAGRPGDPRDVAGAIAFLLTDAARYMIGSELVVDGGWTAE
jgi:NAD(P)-dependent dehydrogenase (short-subunit alcohol dehydrogenase family)